jgi:ELWxxDGT repeat protein
MSGARGSLRAVLAGVACILLLGAAVAGATLQSDGGPAPSFLRDVDGTLYFATYHEEAGGWRLWASGGNPDDTVVLKDGLGLDVELVEVADLLVFGTRGALWKSDGTPAGTVVVKELPFYPNGIKNVRGTVYFSDGRGQLWRSDLTAEGTRLVRDIEPGFPFHDLTPAAITNVNGKIVFRAVNAEIGNELWTSDAPPRAPCPGST